jgi:hypothetical protein
MWLRYHFRCRYGGETGGGWLCARRICGGLTLDHERFDEVIHIHATSLLTHFMYRGCATPHRRERSLCPAPFVKTLVFRTNPTSCTRAICLLTCSSVADIRGKQVGAIGPLLLGPPGSKVSMVLERTALDSPEPKARSPSYKGRARERARTNTHTHTPL